MEPISVHRKAVSPIKRGPSQWRRTRVRPGHWIKVQTVERELLESITEGQSQDSDLEKAIEDSTYIRALPENWDDAGSLAINPRTWERAVTFLRASSLRLLQECGMHLEVPQILPGPAGSVDVHWQNDHFLMLINIRPAGPSDFYGETRDGLTIKGTFIPETHDQGILSWLKQRTP
jgi:hypothetical protein